MEVGAACVGEEASGGLRRQVRRRQEEEETLPDERRLKPTIFYEIGLPVRFAREAEDIGIFGPPVRIPEKIFRISLPLRYLLILVSFFPPNRGLFSESDLFLVARDALTRYKFRAYPVDPLACFVWFGKKKQV